jgi:hypothetical protein
MTLKRAVTYGFFVPQGKAAPGFCSTGQFCDVMCYVWHYKALSLSSQISKPNQSPLLPTPNVPSYKYKYVDINNEIRMSNEQ